MFKPVLATLHVFNPVLATLHVALQSADDLQYLLGPQLVCLSRGESGGWGGGEALEIDLFIPCGNRGWAEHYRLLW